MNKKETKQFKDEREKEWEEFRSTYKSNFPFWIRWIVGTPDLYDKFYFNQGYSIGYKNGLNKASKIVEDLK